MSFFWLLFLFLILQRGIELLIARRNEKWLKARGGIEFGQAHYKLLVVMHTSFLLSLLLEVLFFNKTVISIWPAIILLFVITQCLRIWVILSLGHFWNTKIIVLPDASMIKKGPYRWLKHPNYVIVAIEFIIIPLLFQAYITMTIFSLLNVLILSIRIPAEEKVLNRWTTYEKDFEHHSRFFPSIQRKEQSPARSPIQRKD